MKTTPTLLIVIAIAGLTTACTVKSAVSASETAPIQWSVSNGYTASNKAVHGVMLAYAKSRDGNSELSVRCSPGFSAVYFTPDKSPVPESGVETATYIRSVDGGPEMVGHALMAAHNMAVGDATLVGELIHSKAFRVRYTPLTAGEELTTVDFDTRGLAGAISQMNGACGTL